MHLYVRFASKVAGQTMRIAASDGKSTTATRDLVRIGAWAARRARSRSLTHESADFFFEVTAFVRISASRRDAMRC
jgi:hypothetical protein